MTHRRVLLRLLPGEHFPALDATWPHRPAASPLKTVPRAPPCRSSGNAYAEARAARNLARLHQAEGRLSSASAAWGRAAEALTRVGAAPEAEAATFEGTRTMGEASAP
ncbi:hypothetical protein [Streptomyces sp. NPDC050759]|uniref:hypothetical protein n=1 Tax=Streptomyces sp. NPDC050759 TaxID=3365635 RepID=UPI0037B72AF2